MWCLNQQFPKDMMLSTFLEYILFKQNCRTIQSIFLQDYLQLVYLLLMRCLFRFFAYFVNQFFFLTVFLKFLVYFRCFILQMFCKHPKCVAFHLLILSFTEQFYILNKCNCFFLSHAFGIVSRKSRSTPRSPRFFYIILHFKCRS